MSAMLDRFVIAFSASRAAVRIFDAKLTAVNRESTMVAESSSRTASKSAILRTLFLASTVSAHASMQSENSSAVLRYGLRARASFSVGVRCSYT